MVKLKRWQWIVLIAPIALVITFLLVSAAIQIHDWGLSWIWAIVGLVFVGWRWLLVRWTRPVVTQLEHAIAELSETLPGINGATGAGSKAQRSDAELTKVLTLAQDDLPIWEDWSQFWSRCLGLIGTIASIYAPDAKQPLLNIYVPQAYELLRGTIDDLDQWMTKLSPVLGRLTVAQAYEGYEVYQKFAPSARNVWKLWQWARWVINPAVAITRTATSGLNSRANQELIGNLSQLLREAVLRNLAQQAIALYSGTTGAMTIVEARSEAQSTINSVNSRPETQTLREVMVLAQPASVVEQAPINLLVIGRTGAGKSSVINTLFTEPKAVVDALPSTDKIRSYAWEIGGDRLQLWDTPGYEQVDRDDLRDQVLHHAETCDALLLVTPALDPALQMDLDFLKSLEALPTIVVVNQVDRLRPIREWKPPYDWRSGTRPKEISIREAINYRATLLNAKILPLVTWDADRAAWGQDDLSVALMDCLDPAKRDRLARFLLSREAKTVAAAQIIDRYCFQMTTTQGLTALLKTPILNFLSTATTGSPALGALLATQVPLEHLPLVLGKVQMAYDLFTLLSNGRRDLMSFDLRPLVQPLLDVTGPPDRNAWAFGQVMVDYWISGKLPENKS
ncbi:MAG: 50S ribosome-binding GTPase [Alkalinema sp. CAN_BIN05]|nr:50S ribosome-binding GTPase [Alkalinema sp. CAN_BIN05]